MLVIWFGARQVLQGSMSAGALSAYVIYAVFVGSNAGMLMGVASSVMQARSWSREAGVPRTPAPLQRPAPLSNPHASC